MIWTLAFWQGAGERAVKTFAQALIAGFAVTVPIVDQPWLLSLGLAASAAFLSLVTSIASYDFVSVPTNTTPIPVQPAKSLED